MKWGRQCEELVMKELSFRHLKFEMSIGHASGEVKLAGEYGSRV